MDAEIKVWTLYSLYYTKYVIPKSFSSLAMKTKSAW